MGFHLTNGWAYICVFIGAKLNIGWLFTISSAYVAFLYLPFTVEKIVTIPIAIWLQMRLFPKDDKLHTELVKMHIQAKNDFSYVFRKTIARRTMVKLGM